MTDNKAEKKNEFAQVEEDVLNFWDKAETFKKSVEKEAPSGYFVFYEGPPTANGKPGIHHVLARSFKDIIPRYKTMQGFRVDRKAGWDTHGLPVELQVEKALNISGKPDIEKYGVEEFNKKCKESVWEFKEDWEKLTRRIAFWVDMENPYVTYENSYIESVWNVIKQAHDKGLLYQGHKVVPHCPRCGTALSSHEVAQGYKEVEETSVYVKFKVIKGNDKVEVGDNILAWTTTPWTLPGNVALAVGAKIDYVRINQNDEIYILAKDRLSIMEGEYEVVSEIKGKDLVNVEYIPLFDIKSIKDSGQRSHFVAEAGFVSIEDGTGVVHTAVMYGEDDYQLGEKVGLPKVHTVLEDGKFTDDLEQYGIAGKFVKSETTERIIIDYLKNKELLFKEEMYTHDYPFCWRCKTPLLYYAKDSWFIKMTAVKEALLKNANTITWVPEHIKAGRFGEWLANVKDWAISRERYWGTPMPIWICQKCGEYKVIGSAAELGEDIKDLHRPYIDNVIMKCDCGGDMKREPAVLDVWLDSGSMPYAQYHYPFENQELIEAGRQFPADYICEAIDQTRGWFYTLLAVSTFLDRGAPFKNVICLGHINDKFGKKMSKSIGNIIDPWDMINKYGVDAVRQHMFTLNQPGEGKKYDERDVRDVLRKNVMLFWNVAKFFKLFSEDGQMDSERPNSPHILDQWILARLNQMTEKMTKELEQYHVYEAARELPVFIDELSTWYIRRSRDRFKSGSEADKQIAIKTTGYVLSNLAKLVAPFMPFMAERVWQEVTGNDFKDNDKSVHLENWPAYEEYEGEKEVLSEMEKVRKIVELGLAKRDEAGIKVRQPLQAVKIQGHRVKDQYIELIADELNVKLVESDKGGEEIKVELDTEISAELKQEGIKRELIRTINGMRKEAGLTIKDSITVAYRTDSKNIQAAIVKYQAELQQAVLAKEIKEGEEEIKKEVEIEGDKIVLGIK